MRLNFVIYSQLQFYAVFELHFIFHGLLVPAACILVGQKSKRIVAVILNISGHKLVSKQQKLKIFGHAFIPQH